MIHRDVSGLFIQDRTLNINWASMTLN